MGRYSVDILERLVNKSIVDEITGCWLFLGCKHNQGYGQMKLKYPSAKVEKVHRIAARLFMGYEAGDRSIQVNHILECPNKNCWNPEHLYLGSQKQNVADTITLNRHNIWKPGHPQYRSYETMEQPNTNEPDITPKTPQKEDEEIVDMDELMETEDIEEISEVSD